MKIPVTYKGYKFLAVADGAGLDVWANEENATEEIMATATELWNAIFEARISIFGEAVEEHDTTYGELQASLDELGLR